MNKFYLQRFAEGEESGDGGNKGSNSGNTSYSYEQAEQIADARAAKASKAALTNYFKQQGMSEEEAQQAFRDFRAKREAGKPDVAAITKERDDARAELASYKNRAELASQNVDSNFLEFVESKVAAMVTDKKDFKAAAAEYLKQNPQYLKTTYRVSTGSSTQSTGQESNANTSINALIRRGSGRV